MDGKAVFYFTIDLSSITVLIATIGGYLPGIAAATTIVWTMIRIWETNTIRQLRGKPKNKDGNQDE